MAYRKFIAAQSFQKAPPGDKGDKGDSQQRSMEGGAGDKGDKGDKPATTDESVAQVAPVARVAQFEKREPHFADIMALSIRPCTTCARLHWQQREFEGKDGSVRHYNARTCDHYGKTPVEPTKGCRCIHFESGRA